MLFNKAAIASTLLAPMALAQSSSMSMMSGSMSMSASMSASSSMASGMSSGGSSYISAVLGALQSAGLTSLASAAESIANTTEGMKLLGMLQGGNKTVFAPNNNAFMNISSSIMNNQTMITEILSYHILNSTYNESSVAMSPNYTIARTLLDMGDYVLPNNMSQPIVLQSNSSDSMGFTIVHQNISVSNSTQAANLMIYVIDQVLSLPPNVSTFAQEEFPTLGSTIMQTGLLAPLEETRLLTIFAPNDNALGSVVSDLGSLNQTQVRDLLLNHVINGTAVYTTELSDGNYTSAAGEMFKFMSNSTGDYVMSGNSTAMITSANNVIQNGVVHIIDRVLLNTMADAAAASSAYASATSGYVTETAGLGGSSTSKAATTSGSGGKKGAAGRLTPAASMIGGAVGVVAAVAGGAFILL